MLAKVGMSGRPRSFAILSTVAGSGWPPPFLHRETVIL
jgi:hypothetical protein